MNIFFRILLATALTAALSFADGTPAADTNSAAAPSKSKIGVGARAAIGYGLVWGLDDDWSGGDNEGNPSGLDLQVGIMGRYEISPLLHFTPEILFRYGDYEQELNQADYELSQMDIQIPLLIRANATPKLYGYIGPQLNFNVHSKTTLNVTNDKWLVKPSMSMGDGVEQETFSFGITAGMGFYIIENLGADIRAHIGFTELFPDASPTKIGYDLGGARLMNFHFGINYWIL